MSPAGVLSCQPCSRDRIVLLREWGKDCCCSRVQDSKKNSRWFVDPANLYSGDANFLNPEYKCCLPCIPERDVISRNTSGGGGGPHRKWLWNYMWHMMKRGISTQRKPFVLVTSTLENVNFQSFFVDWVSLQCCSYQIIFPLMFCYKNDISLHI